VRLVDGAVVYAASDLNDYLACAHKVALNRRGLVERSLPDDDNPTLAIVAQKGREHERRVLERFAADGAGVVRIPEGDATAAALREAVDATRAAMRDGARVIYQASFLEGRWTGRADFLLRVDEPSALGAWSYEIADTKLAVQEKPQLLVQLCVYAMLLERVQGRIPKQVYAIFGDGRTTAYDPSRFVPYVRAAQGRFESLAPGIDPDALPERVGACEQCGWSEHCEASRRAVDDVSFVAGIRRDQTKRLRAAGIATLEALATAPLEPVPARFERSTFLTLHRQAALQRAQREDGRLHHELLPPRESGGFRALPQPAGGDVYFDMEGDPLYAPGFGLEYLFGAFVPDDREQPYRAFWGETPEEEREAFVAFVRWLVAHRERHPNAHVYHYAAYEKSALRRLAMRHGACEDEVDDLLRGEVLVDLYAVVRAAVAQSQESYSIKKLEPFYGFVREADVRKGDQSIVAFEHYLMKRDDGEQAAAIRDDIVRYNEEDCRSTHRLHRWILSLRAEAIARGDDCPWRPRRDPKEPTADELRAEKETDDLQRALREGEPTDSPRVLLAELLAYHRREDKPVWWAMFDRYDAAPETTFLDDRDALGGLLESPDHPPELPSRKNQRAIYTYAFPPQQHKVSPGAYLDPDRRDVKAIDVVSVDDEARLVRVKRWPHDPHPRALIPGGPIATKAQRAALRRFAQAVLDGDAPRRYAAAWDVLRRARPRIRGIAEGGRIQPGVRAGAAAIDPADVAALAAALDGSALVVQGPPGTGKTYTGAHVIAALLAAGKRVGVTATSHKAIHNMLHAIEAAVAARGETFRGVKRCDKDDLETHFVSHHAFVANAPANAPFDDYALVAGTSWLFARDDLARLDYLAIDEAGQVSLADALAVATSAENVLLLGDPLQLAHVSQGVHPAGAGASVLQHLLGEDATVAEDRGVFLDRTFRMHPAICDFVSRTVYEGRLHATSSCAVQRIEAPWFSGAGLRYVPVPHEGNVHASEQEAAAIEKIVESLLAGAFTDARGEVRAIGLDDVLVVAPYNAQVRLLRQRLGRRFGPGVRVGTVDKFQGQEAPVVLYSLAASSAEDAPRGADFLFDGNRFNVAISRGRALAAIVCSPRLLESRCGSVEQLLAVAGFCAFAEAAEESAAAARPLSASGADSFN